MPPRRHLPPTHHTHHISSTQKIPQAKQDIYSFANQIVVDITNLAVVFDETGGCHLSQRAWEDLQETRWAMEIFVIDAEMFTNLIQGPGQQNM